MGPCWHACPALFRLWLFGGLMRTVHPMEPAHRDVGSALNISKHWQECGYSRGVGASPCMPARHCLCGTGPAATSWRHGRIRMHASHSARTQPQRLSPKAWRKKTPAVALAARMPLRVTMRKAHTNQVSHHEVKLPLVWTYIQCEAARKRRGMGPKKAQRRSRSC